MISLFFYMQLEWGGGHFGKKAYIEFEIPSPIHISPQYFLNPMYLNICSTETIPILILLKKNQKYTPIHDVGYKIIR